MIERGRQYKRFAGAVLALALVLAAMCLPGCAPSAVQPAKVGGALQEGPTFDLNAYLRDAETFLRQATYVRFESKSNTDMAFADANLNNAKDLLARLDALETHLNTGTAAAARVTFGDGTFVLPDKSYLEEFIREQRSTVATLREKLLNMYNSRLELHKELSKAASGYGLLASALPVGSTTLKTNQIEAGASRVLGNFKKSWALNASPAIQKLVLTRILAYVLYNI